MVKIKTLAVFALLIIAGLISLRAEQPDYEKLKADAEKLYAEGSYGLAYEMYVRAESISLPPAEAHWVKFRVADTLWRSQAATQTSDPTKYEQARQQLDALVRDVQREEDRDRIWAEVYESLGDFWWMRRDARNWRQAWPNYQKALDWWAGTQDIELARRRYLKMVWTMAEPPGIEPYYYYGYYGNAIPLEILDNALRIAQTENDKARAHYLVAMTTRGNWNYAHRVPEEFEAAMRPGKTTDWYDDALYNYAEWLASNGRITIGTDGQQRREHDYVKALELFRRLIREYQKGETRYYDQANQQIENITKPIVGVSVSNIFLPDSEVQFHLSWRNVKTINLALYKVDLTQDVRFSNRQEDGDNWIQQINLAGRAKTKSWSKETQDKGDYKPGQDAVRVDGKLPMGAYIVEATNGATKARDLVLVTDASLVLKTSGRQALVYFCNALDGSPIANANVKLWRQRYTASRWMWMEAVQTTNRDGIAVFDIADRENSRQLFVSASLTDRQAFSLGYSYGYAREQEAWRVYAFTDRPAYRPGEKAQWKFVARKYNGSVYSTPAQQSVRFEITDPRGTKVKEETVTLNTFGSAWSSLDLTEAMPLGEYQIAFWDQARRQHIGSAKLFRLEEYKLPEFKVSVETPEENGKKKAFRVGEKVEVNIQTDYYFGGPVAQATVEVLVHQSPFYHWWYPRRDFPWFYEDMMPRPYYYGGRQGQIIKRETLKTDLDGKATLTFDTPANTPQDFEYYIEARVTDQSRREIIGSGTVRVTRQRYYVHPYPKHNLYRPQDKVAVDLKALDANNQPMQVEGTVKLTRDYWYEIWLDPSGREVKGDELKRLRERTRIFPPPPRPGEKPWQLKFRGYEHDDIFTRAVKTNADGEAEFTFTPEREGYYRVAWTSEDKGSMPIRAETAVWVATNATTELGYRYGGVEIIVDKDTFRAGQRAPVMLAAPTSDRYVLFSIEGEDLYSYQLVHLTGTAKLIEVPVEERHVPNIFLTAAMVSDRQIFMDTKQVIVPPVEHFLKVEVKSDRGEYQPREEGTLTVTTRDHNDKPVAAEVALGLVDESVYYIQQDYAADPRQFYYGRKRPQYIQTQSTFQQKVYAKLIEGADKQLADEFFERDEDRRAYGAVVGGVPGGVRGRAGEGAGMGVSRDVAALELRAEVAAKSEAGTIGRLAAPPPPPAAGPVGAREQGQTSEPAVQVRSDFRATILWQPDVVTDASGTATVKVKFPDSLTTWKALARVATAGNEFGIADASARTNQPLIVRLQAPRFFVVGDKLTLSAVINNNTDKPMTVTTNFDTGVGAVNPRVVQARDPQRTLEYIKTEVPANGEARVDWPVMVVNPGETKIKVTTRGDKYADAMEKTYSVYEHGIEKLIVKSGKVRGDDIMVKLDIPKERKAGSTAMTVQVTPSMAVMMLDALPYLIGYPYGCTEQTMSRFLPAAIVAKTLKDLGLKSEDIMGKMFGGIEPQYVSQTQPRGPRDLDRLDSMVRQGLRRLYDFQHSDGGWGWWKEGDSDHFMTAYVVWGLVLARDAGIDVRDDVLRRGVEYLDKEIVEAETQYDQQAWMLHALSVYHKSSRRSEVARFQARAFDNLWANRDKLNAYTRALLALGAHSFGYADRATTLVRNLENGVKIDRTPDTSVIQRGGQSSEGAMGTAHWGEDGIYWRWSDGGVEATSFALRALLTIDPQNKLIEPVTNWLVKNRRGAQWSNTRDTAITVLALNDYLRASGELAADLEYELYVNGRSVAAKRVTPDDVLNAPSQFAIDRESIRDGTNEIRIVRKSGRGPIYFAAQAEFFSLEEPITPTGNEIFVRRQYYKLVGRPTLLKGYVYDRQPLNDGESVTSGDRVEAVVTIEAKNNYEYLVFEDLKPAGLEAVQIRSGERLYAKELKSSAVGQEPPQSAIAYTGRARWVYQELRDRKVALFIDKLPEGVWEIRYDLRAEVPGQFHALPLMGHAMYVPEIRSNGTEVRISVADKK